MPVREQKKQKNRATIIAAASRLIDAGGYQAAGMRDIAAAAGVSYQTLYNYFATKALIVQALLQQDVQHSNEQVDLLIKQFDGALIDTLNAINAVRIDALSQRNRSLWREVCVDLLKRSNDAASIYQVVDRAAHARLSALLRIAQGTGHLDLSLDVELMAHTLFGLTEFAFLQYVMDSGVGRETVQRTLDEQMRMIVGPYLTV